MNSSYRENSLSAGDSPRSHRLGGGEGLSLLPSPASHPTAAPTAVPPAHRPPEPLLPPRGIAAPPRGSGTWLEERGHRRAGSAPWSRSSRRSGPELSYAGAARCSRKHWAPCPVLSSGVSTNHGRRFAATLCPKHQWGQSPRLPLSPPSSPQAHPHRDTRAILQHLFHCRGAAGANPPSPAPGAAPGRGHQAASSPQGPAAGRGGGVPAVAQASREL